MVQKDNLNCLPPTFSEENTLNIPLTDTLLKEIIGLTTFWVTAYHDLGEPFIKKAEDELYEHIKKDLQSGHLLRT